MDTMSSLVGGLFENQVRKRMKSAAAEAMEGVNLSEILQLAGADDEADAALKSVIAERVAEYATRAMDEARKRKIKLGAAAIIIAARKQ